MIRFENRKWKTKTLADICHGIEYGVTASAEDEGNAILLRITDIDGAGKIGSALRFTTLSEIAFKRYELKKDDLLIARSGATAGKPYIHKLDGKFVFGSYLLRIKLDKTQANPEFVFNFLYSANFLQQLKKIKIGGAQPNISTTNLRTIKIPLPPLVEQARLVELFQSIEESILRAQEQVGSLKALRKTLNNGLAIQNPVFGDLLSSKNCQPRQFDNLTDCIEEHDKNPFENSITRFVGLENIEADNFQIQGWGNIEDGTTFTKRFAKGDVLFGKRRAYLKKVAVADFDGICSSDILVFRAKPETMLSRLLPYYASSDPFFDHAVSTSAGSLSPRTKWKDLAVFKLSVPEREVQEKIAGVFQQFETVLSQLRSQTKSLKALKQKLLSEILG